MNIKVLCNFLDVFLSTKCYMLLTINILYQIINMMCIKKYMNLQEKYFFRNFVKD